MEKLDWKEIVAKVLSWGFPAVFTILGIALTAAHNQLDIAVYWGIILIVLGVVMYLITYIIDTKVKLLISDNKSLTTKIDNLTNQVNNLQTENLELRNQITKLEVTLDLLSKKEK